MIDDPKVLLIGEDIGRAGRSVPGYRGACRAEFGADRGVIDSLLAESGIVGTAIGLALRGYRPVCEIQFDGFIYPAFDQIVSQLAKMRARSAGTADGSRSQSGFPPAAGWGRWSITASPTKRISVVPAGLRVIACASPADAYWMIQQAVACDDPVIFYEPKRRYWDKAEVTARRRARPRELPALTRPVVRQARE